MFLMTFLVVNFADSKQKLENDLLRAASVAQKYNCSLVRLDFQQEDGFVSALPLGVNRIKIQGGLTTSAVAVFVPFTTQEIFHGGEALYYGLNATSGNMILADRKKAENAQRHDLRYARQRQELFRKAFHRGCVPEHKGRYPDLRPRGGIFSAGEPSGSPGHQNLSNQHAVCEPYGY